MALEIHRLVNSRHAKFTNFVEVGKPLIALFRRLTPAHSSTPRKLYTDDMRGSSFLFALTEKTMN